MYIKTRFLMGLLVASAAAAQTTPRQVQALLEPPLVSPDVIAAELRQYLAARVPPLPKPHSAAEWTSEAGRIRRKLLDDVVFHGWPRAWVEAPPKFEDAGGVAAGPGYRVRKLRYEIVPGFLSTAILYEPDPLPAKAPAILNVNGHVGAPGKSVEYKQKRCINQARHGIIALNLEWLAFGELAGKENEHWFGAHLDLAGANGAGLFYLAMRMGLDYLERHPHADPARLGVTGLSGGGWQTIVLSALDERVAASVPVAGFSSLLSRIERPMDTGDLEQNPTDFYQGQDYPHLAAMRAPRPTLLVYNAEDDCCFRAALVKPDIFDAVKPFFELYGAGQKLAWHENTDPSTHNYQLDNRRQAYRFFAQQFGVAGFDDEIPVEGEIKSYDELKAGLPAGNLTILGLARRLARELREPAGAAALPETVRYRPVAMRHAWALDNSKRQGLETVSYRFEFGNGLSAAGVLLRAIDQPRPARASLVLHDEGKKTAGEDASERVNRGELVLAADLLFTGDAAPRKPASFTYAQMIAGTGERPLGLEAAQLIALAEWLRATASTAALRVETAGGRSQVIALTAAALKPGLFAEVVVRGGMASLGELLERPVEYSAAPDLFCLDLYRKFDLGSLAQFAAPTRVR
jgi:dienelactone hydrolase